MISNKDVSNAVASWSEQERHLSPRDVDRSNLADHITWWLGILCLVLLFLVAMNYSSRNMGGAGVQIPYNTFSWLAASLFVLVSLVRMFLLKKVVLHTSMAFYGAALFCLLLPFVYSDLLFLDVESLRLIGVLGGVVFFLALQQYTGRRFNYYLVSILIVSTAIQTAWGLTQYYFIFESSPLFWSARQGRPYGVFQQVNVFSIYLALGSMLVLYALSCSVRRSIYLILLVVSIVFANAHLAMLSAADTARLVGFLSVSIYLGHLWGRKLLSGKLVILFALAITLGSFLPRSWFDVRPSLEPNVISSSGNVGSVTRLVQSSGASNESEVTPKNVDWWRVLGTRPVIYKVSFDMFLDKPLTGHGIGTFRKQYLVYQGQFLKENPGAPAEFNLSHPHNEPLLWMIELGFLPGIGFVLILLGWLLGVRSGSLDLTILLLALPLVLQSLLELPFYHSVAHYLSFFAIMVIAMRGEWVRRFAIPRWPAFLVGPMAVFSAWKVWVFLLSTYYALIMFLSFNASGREDVGYLLKVNNPSAFKLRYEFELFQWQLRAARRNGEIEIEQLNNYLRWAFSTVQYAPMQSTYENFVMCLVLIDNLPAARQFTEEGLLMYPYSQKLIDFDRQLVTVEKAHE